MYLKATIEIIKYNQESSFFDRNIYDKIKR